MSQCHNCCVVDQRNGVRMYSPPSRFLNALNTAVNQLPTVSGPPPCSTVSHSSKIDALPRFSDSSCVPIKCGSHCPSPTYACPCGAVREDSLSLANSQSAAPAHRPELSPRCIPTALSVGTLSQLTTTVASPEGN